jgi:hypothetical protein
MQKYTILGRVMGILTWFFKERFCISDRGVALGCINMSSLASIGSW